MQHVRGRFFIHECFMNTFYRRIQQRAQERHSLYTPRELFHRFLYVRILTYSIFSFLKIPPINRSVRLV